MDIGELYDEHIADTYDSDALGLLRGGRELALQQLAPHLRALEGDVVVDLALGTGESLLALKPRLPGARLHGIDISARMLAVARQKLPEVHTIHDDAARVGQHFGPGSVDVALMHFLTTYIDARAVIRDVAIALKPGGYLSLVSSTYESFPAIHALALSVLPPELIKSVNPAPEGGAELAELMRAAGLDVVEQANFERPIAFEGPAELALWGMQSGFFTHVLSVLPPAQLQALASQSEHFPLQDRYQAAALLARKPM
jgi:ubiquinone/menaquinone biosynthesis C-methylase UbiE